MWQRVRFFLSLIFDVIFEHLKKQICCVDLICLGSELVADLQIISMLSILKILNVLRIMFVIYAPNDSPMDAIWLIIEQHISRMRSRFNVQNVTNGNDWGLVGMTSQKSTDGRFQAKSSCNQQFWGHKCA